ncbi:Riboflavin biosynthesis protein RibD [Fuerstiella marisgermanici]|uniref:Riboflavin biosynthesis protein RibD n=2 Tax=Fuerstiella marisgermanici TaxID=1891926 RepID=A0A1P8WL77_9PLAN|nr:bifunctional diaminohydroxyphosphoribosylaminopyrimidine deaminase/5-amino-6-(5-phosphoribosylamino)uracil reductase RibD [Fuerstiella marisgermanici]APZ94819.1 Riboflavin biosynthesis protein RibD [Fuerstiella marisgermanici]
MQHALQVARQGLGHVEPNPAVGAVIVDENLNWIADGFHQKFGGPHAEIDAIAAAGERTRGAELFVTLEPCSHHGKTPPCADAVIAAGFRRVVIGCQDPAPHVAGNGIARIQEAGIDVAVGVCEDEAIDLIAPFRKLMLQKQPWVHAKWAMTLDGRIATRTGHSKWISNEQSRAEVHRLRGHMDAIITGAGTVRADNPTLTARPAGPRKAMRVVVDTDGGSIVSDGNLLKTINEAPLLLCAAEASATSDHVKMLAGLGVEVFTTSKTDRSAALAQLLAELGRRNITNVLVEAGSGLLGSFFDGRHVDEVHVFVAPKIVGGTGALSPIGGQGMAQVSEDASINSMLVQQFGNDLLIEGRLRSSAS